MNKDIKDIIVEFAEQSNQMNNFQEKDIGIIFARSVLENRRLIL